MEDSGVCETRKQCPKLDSNPGQLTGGPEPPLMCQKVLGKF